MHAIDDWLRSHSKSWTIQRIVFETGQLSTHYYHGLVSLAGNVHLILPGIVARDAEGAAQFKTDKNDARGLAELARTGWYKSVHVKSDVGVHVGLTPRRYASGEIDRSGGISKCGNGALRTLLFEASVTMLTRSSKWSRLKSWGVRLAQRNGFKAASTAVARKLAVVMHRMWVDETDFAYGEMPAAQAA